MYVDRNNPLEVLIEELNSKKMVTFSERNELKKLLELEPSIHMAHIIILDLRLGKSCLPEINEWAKRKFSELSEKEKELVCSFLPGGYAKQYLI